jgi:hypothetical protein
MSQPQRVTTSQVGQFAVQKIQQATSLNQNKTILGKVTVKAPNSFTIQAILPSPVNNKAATTSPIEISFDSKIDEVLLVKTITSGKTSTIQDVKSSFSSLKVGQEVMVKILNGKKTVYIAAS